MTIPQVWLTPRNVEWKYGPALPKVVILSCFVVFLPSLAVPGICRFIHVTIPKVQLLRGRKLNRSHQGWQMNNALVKISHDQAVTAKG